MNTILLTVHFLKEKVDDIQKQKIIQLKNLPQILPIPSLGKSFSFKPCAQIYSIDRKEVCVLKYSNFDQAYAKLFLMPKI